MILNLDREYEIKCNLGTVKDVEARFNKPFYALMRGLEQMTAAEQIRLLYVGARRADAALTEAEFAAACEEHLGMGELMEALESFVYQLQYPGKSREEIQKTIEKKLQQARKMQDSTGTKSFAPAV